MVAVVRGVGIVFVLVNLIRQMILLMVQLHAVRSGQMAILFRAHRRFFFVQRRFLGFQILRLTRSERATLDSVNDSILLVFLAFSHRSGRWRGRRFSRL
jgi:hypothetical protein